RAGERMKPAIHNASARQHSGVWLFPVVFRLRSEEPKRRPGGEMAVKVEGIVGGGMHAQKAPGGSTVTRIDRLARSTAIVKQIVEAKAQFRSLAEPWVDIGASTGRL